MLYKMVEMRSIMKTLKIIFLFTLTLCLSFVLISPSKADNAKNDFTVGDYWIRRVFQTDAPQSFVLEKNTIIGESNFNGIPCWIVENRVIGKDEYNIRCLDKKYLLIIKSEHYINNILAVSYEFEDISDTDGIKNAYKKLEFENNFSYGGNIISYNYTENTQEKYYQKFSLNSSGLELVNISIGTFPSIHRETITETKWTDFLIFEGYERYDLHSWHSLDLNGIEVIMFVSNKTAFLIEYKIGNRYAKNYNESNTSISINNINYLKNSYKPTYLFKNKINFNKVKGFFVSHVVDIISVLAAIITMWLIVPFITKLFFPVPSTPNTFDTGSYFYYLSRTSISGISGFIVLSNIRKLEKIKIIKTHFLLLTIWFFLFSLFTLLSDQESGLIFWSIFLTVVLILRACSINILQVADTFLFLSTFIYSLIFFILILNYMIDVGGYDNILSNIVTGFSFLVMAIGANRCAYSLKQYWHGEKNYSSPLLTIYSTEVVVLFFASLFYSINLASKTNNPYFLIGGFLFIYILAMVSDPIEKSLKKEFNPESKCNRFLEIITWFFMTPVFVIYILYYLYKLENRDNKLIREFLVEIKKHGGSVRASIMSNNLNIGLHETLRLFHLVTEKYDNIKLFKKELKSDINNKRFDFVIIDTFWNSEEHHEHSILNLINEDEENLLTKITNDTKFVETLRQDLGSTNIITRENAQKKWDLIALLYEKGILLPIFENKIKESISEKTDKIFYTW